MQLEHDRRISRATELMAAEGLDALVLSTSNKSQSLYYLTGLDRLCANLVLLRNGRNTLFILDQDLLDAKDTAHADNIRTYSSTIAQFKAIAETIEECGLKDGSVGVDTPFLRATFHDSLKAALPAAITITDATKVTGQLRLIKTQYEIDLIRKASAIAVKALESTTDLIRSGIAREPLAILVFNGFYSSLIMYGQVCERQFLLVLLQNPPLLCLHICLSLVKFNVTRLV